MSIQNPVRTLNAEVARKIAAGEVIDRPNAIIRELMDNAIDADSTSITVEITGGGIDKIRIVDNGCGLTKEDLQNCAKPHATSKISTETDLLNLSTLGFRGEALASIAAVARLSIVSGGWKMRASITEDHIIEQVAETKGSIVMSEGLFENFPARRQFLKRPATEALMCKNTFIEKAMARPDIAFRFVQDGELKIDLPSGQSFKDRFVSANSYSEPEELFYEITGSSGSTNPDWKFSVVIGEPAVSRTNKKDIFIYVNGRRIQEYSLVQAVEYGGQGYFPNGTYPVAVVFIEINPNLVDFNIHPAKKEARFYDISALHHGLSSTIKSFFQNYTLQNFREDKSTDEVRAQEDLFSTPDSTYARQTVSSAPASAFRTAQSESAFSYKNSDIFSKDSDKSFKASSASSASYKPSALYEKHISYKANQTGESSFSDFRAKYLGGENSSSTHKNSFSYIRNDKLAEAALEAASETPQTISEEQKIKYVGKCLGTFLLAEKNNCLYLIDQHAVHERILFDNLMKNQGKSQNLLIPYKIKTESKSQDNQLEKLKDSLTTIGFKTEKITDGEWEISTIPERWTGSVYDLQSLIFVKQVEPEEIIRSIAAMTACKAAIKDGYIIDDQTAEELIQKTFTLEDPHCPHGRPIYTVISRAKLFELVKRT